MNARNIILIICLLMSSFAQAGRSREEMGVKFNQKKPETSQAVKTKSNPQDENQAKPVDQPKSDKAVEPNVQEELKPESK